MRAGIRWLFGAARRERKHRVEELYRENSRIVYYFLFSRCKNEALAEDLMQETFVKAMESIDRYDGSCKVTTWLCQIAKHLLYQYWAKAKNEHPLELDESLASGENTETQVIMKIELADVWQRLEELPEQTKRVMMLRVLSDLTFGEIGRMLGRSENWARVTYFRGKQTLLKEVDTDEMGL